MFGEGGGAEPANPHAALADLAVRQGEQAVAQYPCAQPHHLLGRVALNRHAAHQKDVTACQLGHVNFLPSSYFPKFVFYGIGAVKGYRQAPLLIAVTSQLGNDGDGEGIRDTTDSNGQHGCAARARVASLGRRCSTDPLWCGELLPSTGREPRAVELLRTRPVVRAS